MDFRKALGGPDNLILLAISGLALIYVTTGKDAWSDQKWARAAGAASGAVGLLKSGKLIGKKEGWMEGEEDGFQRGYWLPNPAISMEQRGRGMVDNIATGVTSGVINAGADRVASLAVEQLQGIWPTAEPAPPASEDEAPKPPRLPAGWRIDSKGRFRDRQGRIASDERRRRTLRAE
jgi:hypothetical protein